MKNIVSKEARTLIDICKSLQISKWLEIVDMVEKQGGRTENFSFNDWFVMWLVQQNEVLNRITGEYFSLTGFFDLSQVVPFAPIFNNKEEIEYILKDLIDKGLVTLKGMK